jgi:hypothetical protein
VAREVFQTSERRWTVAAAGLVRLQTDLCRTAEAMVASKRTKSRHHRRGGASWTEDDDAAYEGYLAELSIVRCAEFGAALRAVSKRSRD